MKKQSLSISIPEPCHEKWSEMTPADKGRHCLSCQKTVVDFTRMPKVKIAEFVSENQGSMCGRFTSDQLNVELIAPKPTKSWLKYAAIILGLVPTIGYGQGVSNKHVPVPSHINDEYELGEVVDIDIPKRGEININLSQKNAQTKIVSGTVVDDKTGESILIGTVKLFKNGKVIKSITTDLDGKFTIDISKGSIIEASYLGYFPTKIHVKDINVNKAIEMRLKESALNGMVEIVGLFALLPNEDKRAKDDVLRKIENIDSKKIENIEIQSEENEKVQSSRINQLEDGVWEVKTTLHRQLPNVGLVGFIPPFEEIEDISTVEKGEVEHKKEGEEKEEMMHYLLPTIEFTSYKIPVVKGDFMCSSVVVTGELTYSELSWFQRLWRKFKNLVKGSHEEAVKNRELSQIQPITHTTKYIDITPTEKITLEEKNGFKIGEERVNIKVFPNPTSGYVSISIPDEITEFQLNISDIKNELIYTKEYFANPNTLDLSSLISGTYIVSIIHQDKLIYSEMLIKM